MEKNDKAKDLADLVAGVTSFEKVGEPCIDSDTLMRYAFDELTEEANRHIRAHLLFCDACAKEVAILWRVRKEASPTLRTEDFVEGKGFERRRAASAGSSSLDAHGADQPGRQQTTIKY